MSSNLADLSPPCSLENSLSVDSRPAVTPTESTPAILTKPLEGQIGIVFVGSYAPRRCGIATFTADLMAAVTAAHPQVRPMVLGVTEPLGQHAYPNEVAFEIRQNVKADYVKAWDNGINN